MVTINDIIKEIGKTIYDEFGELYDIYTEVVKQGFKEPCFFITNISSDQSLYVGERYLITNEFCIQYFPLDCENPKHECHDVVQKLYRCLEYIDPGELLIGSNMHYEIVDGILNFLINYNFFARKETLKSKVENLNHNVKAKE